MRSRPAWRTAERQTYRSGRVGQAGGVDDVDEFEHIRLFFFFQEVESSDRDRCGGCQHQYVLPGPPGLFPGSSIVYLLLKISFLFTSSRISSDWTLVSSGVERRQRTSNW